MLDVLLTLKKNNQQNILLCARDLLLIIKASNHLNFWKECILRLLLGFPGGAVVESLPANAGDTGSSPGLGRSHMPRSN